MSLVRRIKALVNALAESPSPALHALPRAAKTPKRGARRQRYRARLRSGNLDFVTIDELAIWTRQFVEALPETYDVVIGIPRSGMLVASIVASRLARPLTTPELFVEDRWWSSRLLEPLAPTDVHSVLLIDDSIDRGTSLSAAKSIIARCPRPTRITTAALIAHRPEATALVDFHHRMLPHPTIFEWNLMHSKPMARLSASLEALTARSGRIPAYAIDIVIAQGDEATRARTDALLRNRGVRYDELVMTAGRDPVDVIAEASPDLHLAGSLAEAERIGATLGIPTISLDEMQLVGSLR